jgi:EAL domain-containing protein (putative c-di-GMP-specific phosphodiesterase class I)
MPAAATAPHDRFLAFAFAAADLLVEASETGVITFAAGAFRVRLGRPPEAFVGQRVTALLTPEDRAPLAIALATLGLRRRIQPMVLRLNDAPRTPTSIAGLMMPGPPPRIYLTLGPPPLAAPAPLGAPAAPVDGRAFVRELQAHLRAGLGGEVSLVEVKNWQALRESLPSQQWQAFAAAIDEAIGAGDRNLVAGEVAAGRFGVLGQASGELDEIMRRMAEVLRTTQPGAETEVQGAHLVLGGQSLSISQASRALRWALAQFAAGGAAAAEAAGCAGGLAGVMAQAEWRGRGLRRAIADRRFGMSFQPVVHLADRHVHHYESLLRLLYSMEGAPGTTQEFILFVEAVGLAEELDLAVAEQVIALLHRTPQAAVAINVSGLSMQSAGFRDRLLALVAGAPELAGTGRLLVELTETAEIDDMAAAALSIERLRAAGVPVCLDDFGAGAAAFHYLSDFRVDYVKIDGEYVQRAAREERECRLVASMVEMATAAGALVVAEMIETDEQARLMQRLGVQFGQGWLFGHPGTLPGALRRGKD